MDLNLIKKELHIQRLRNGQIKRKQKLIDSGQPFFTSDDKRKFALAKCIQYHNYIGKYIIENYDMDYKTISSKVVKILKREYKDNKNLITQIDKIRAIIYEQTNKDMPIEKIIELRRITIDIRAKESINKKVL